MFLKRQKDDDVFFTYTSDNRRTSYRMRLPEDEIVTFTLDKKDYNVIDIGAGGLSFKNTDFHPGDGGPITLKLPHPHKPVMAVLEIRAICNKGVCHCAFAQIEEEHAERIHQYLLERQKALIRRKKR